jgi:hypothetical protein
VVLVTAVGSHEVDEAADGVPLQVCAAHQLHQQPHKRFKRCCPCRHSRTALMYQPLSSQSLCE